MKTNQKTTMIEDARVKNKKETGTSPDRTEGQEKRRQVTVKPFEEPPSEVILNVPRLTLKKLGMKAKK